MEKKELTSEQKIEKFIKWLKFERSCANGLACSSGSSWNHAYSGAFDDVYGEAKRIFVVPKKRKPKV